MILSLPIAEIFSSVQGEATFSGVAMDFVRLAGCTVGKPLTKEERAAEQTDLPMYTERCCSALNESFLCDTNYRMTERLRPEEIVERTGNAYRVCLTGGEPLMHNVVPLVDALISANKYVHIETSGTKSLTDLRTIFSSFKFGSMLWITVSPKRGFLYSSLTLADEIKVLVGESFNEELFVREFKAFFETEKLWIQPINDEHTIRMENVQRCLELQDKYKKLRISTQLHKLWKVR